ncbi:Pentacotripeptide-repeat region of PRORP [Dillenia turbinata]|uniref:Pentacotripeptide-repeat region of PRORP n=1 Tax=Dillenia turbinata TaxID=194707 RepID=A0AAN8YU46_9MAGN
MHALSIWPSKGDIWAIPQLNSRVGFSCKFGRRRRRKRWDAFDSGFVSRSTCALCFSCNLRQIRVRSCCGNSNLELGSGFLSGYPKLKFVLFSVPQKAFMRFAWAMEAMEAKAIDNDLTVENSNSLDGLSVEFENKEANGFALDGVEEDEMLLGENENGDREEELRLEDRKENDDVHEDNCTRIDVRGLAFSLQDAKTADDVEEVLKDKGKLPLQVYSSIIRGFGRDRRLDPAVALVQWLKRKKESMDDFGPNLFIYNSLLGAVKQSKKFDMVGNVMDDMKQDGIVPNIVTCNTLMSVHLEQGQVEEALDLLEVINKKGLSPTPATYSTALLAYRRMEDGNGALNFFMDIREKYVKGEIGKDAEDYWRSEFAKLEDFTIRICYQVMRRWLVKRKHLGVTVLRLLADMDRAELHLGRDELQRLVWACSHEQDYVVARELYDRIREKSSDISLSVCNHVIWLMGKAKKWWAALEIYEDLLDRGPKPNNLSYELIVSHFNTLLTAAKRRGIWRWGVRLLNKMEEKGLRPGSREWNAVLLACSKASETTAAVQIFKRMIEQGEKPTIISYGALLSALEKGKLYDEAFRVWDHMLKVGVKPNTHAYTIMASVCIGQGKFEMINSIIGEMISTGNQPTVVTFNAVISGFARNGMGSVAYEWFQRMKSHKIAPNEITYEMLIEALAKDGKPRVAYDLYLRAHNEGLNLSTKAYDAIVNSSHAYGATMDLTILGRQPREKKQKLKIRKNLTEFCSMAGIPRRSKPFDRNEDFFSEQGRNL